MRGLRFGLGFGRGGGGVVPVLSAFGAGSIDDLELDPPAIFIEHNTSGTLTGDFHSLATPPAKEAGDIGFFTTSLSGEAVTDISTALNTFLDLHPGETGYLHFRLTNGAGDSNVITTQVITTPSPYGPNLWGGADPASFTGANAVSTTNVLTIGVTYLVEFSHAGSGTLRVRIGSNTNDASVVDTGSFSQEIICDAGGDDIIFQSAGFVGDISSISVRAVL